MLKYIGPIGDGRLDDMIEVSHPISISAEAEVPESHGHGHELRKSYSSGLGWYLSIFLS